MLSVKKYNYKSWDEKYIDGQVDLSKLKINASWKALFEANVSVLKTVNTDLTDSIELIKKAHLQIYPYPFFVFAAFNKTPFDQVKVVILGQDPYFTCDVHNSKTIPQAMGLSFSVPVGIKTPSSLQNVYKNLVKFGHIDKPPSHGNLSSWANQGCLLLNTSLTVIHGNKNCHSEIWREFTDNVIKYISDNKENVVFLLWGSSALSKLNLINVKKHKVIVSSHPSGLSCNKSLREYGSFVTVDHFGEANKYLEKKGLDKIQW